MKRINEKRRFPYFWQPLIEQPEIDEVIASMKSGWLGTGPKVFKFAYMFKKYKGIRFADRTVSVPLSAKLLAKDVKYAIGTVRKIMSSNLLL